MRYVASIRYDGSKLYGFQRLNRHKTVQGELERVLTKINKTVVYVKGAGRTDRGVHAMDQKVHFDLNVNIPESHIAEAMNSMLDKAIYVRDVKMVGSDFHARFDVKYKVYEYSISIGEYNPLENDYTYFYPNKLDIRKMRKASRYLLGKHSYEAFTSGERESYNSILYSIKFKKSKDQILITFKGKSFYRYMVRNLVGALISVGSGKVDAKEMPKMFDKKAKHFAYTTVPACGLCLKKIEY